MMSSFRIDTRLCVADGDVAYRRDLRVQYAEFSIDVVEGEYYHCVINNGYSYLVSTESIVENGALAHPEKVKWIIVLITNGVIVKIPKGIVKLYFTLEGNPINVTEIPNVIWVRRVKAE